MGGNLESVLGFVEALDVVLAEARRVHLVATARVALGSLEARERVLAQDIRADRDQPPFDRATRDGFALKAADAGRTLRILGQVRAGEMWQGPAVEQGEALEIMTGAPLPAGADCVVMIEHVEVHDMTVKLSEGRTIRAGENVVPRGAEARSGDLVLTAGTWIGPAQVAVAASLGCAELTVYERPRVAILSTGDELVEVAAQPESWQIRNSNSYALQSLVRDEGGAALRLAMARDERPDLIERITSGIASDLLVLSGGVSMGKYDLVEDVLRDFGAEFFFTGALIQPGKPVVFGRIPKRSFQAYDGTPQDSASPGEWTYFFGLPGNPISTQVTFRLFVAPMLRALMGRKDIRPVFVEARLSEDVKGGARVTRFLPADLTSTWDGATIRPVPWQGSGDLAANARANSYVVLPAGVPSFHAGETVRVLLR